MIVAGGTRKRAELPPILNGSECEAGSCGDEREGPSRTGMRMGGAAAGSGVSRGKPTRDSDPAPSPHQTRGADEVSWYMQRYE